MLGRNVWCDSTETFTLQDAIDKLSLEHRQKAFKLDPYICEQEARSSLLGLLTSYLGSSESAQRQAVRTWDVVASLFNLTHSIQTRALALKLVNSFRQ